MGFIMANGFAAPQLPTRFRRYSKVKETSPEAMRQFDRSKPLVFAILRRFSRILNSAKLISNSPYGVRFWRSTKISWNYYVKMRVIAFTVGLAAVEDHIW
jgi:hypothetical protein